MFLPVRVGFRRSCKNLHLTNWGRPSYLASKDLILSIVFTKFTSYITIYSLFFYPTFLLFLYYRVSIDKGNYSFSILLLCRRDVVFYILRLRSHGTGRIRDRTQIRPVTAVHTKPDKLQVKKCSHGAGRIRARNYSLNFVVVMSLYSL